MQAYYEHISDSYRRPEVTNLILDANDTYGGYVNPTDSSRLQAFPGPGSVMIDAVNNLHSGHPTQILFGDIQSNTAVHLYRYATEDTHDGVQGTQFFENMGQYYYLLGFDEQENPATPTTGMPYIPAYAADGVIGVTRKSNDLLYALWEPMLYVTFVNTTGADLTITLSGTGDAVGIVNEVTGTYDRNACGTTLTVPAKSGETNGRIRIVLPAATAGASFTATAVNTHLNHQLSVSGVFCAQDPYGSGSQNVRYGSTATYSGELQFDPTGVIVTYNETEDPSIVYDVNGGVW